MRIRPLRLAACISWSISWTFSPALLADEAKISLPAVFRSHCVKCHGERGRPKGRVDLHALKSDAELWEKPRLLEKLIGALEDQEMPPEDEPPLPEGTRERTIARLRDMLAQVSQSEAFGPTPIRRMNRFQYNNAVVDLLELDRNIFALNERLMRRRSDYFQPASKKMPKRVRVSSRPLAKDIDNQRPEGFRGVAAFPQDKRAEHGFDNRADHLTLSPLLMESFLQLSQTIVGSPDLNPKECRSWDRLFAPPGQPARAVVEGRYEAEDAGATRIAGASNGYVGPQSAKRWSENSQLFWQCSGKDQELTVSFDVTAPGNGLRFRFTQAHDYGMFDVYLDDALVSTAVDLYSSGAQLVDFSVQPLQLQPGRHTLKFKCVGKRNESRAHYFGLDYFEVRGQDRAAESRSEERLTSAVIRARLAAFLRRAFRRPADAETIDRFATFAEGQLSSGASFEETMRTVAGAVLGMPEFLYLYETSSKNASGSETSAEGNPGRQRIDDFELATRLTQFFWSSIPDDTLLDLAEAGTLSNPSVLSGQIDRMLDDRRSSRFCDNFPAQWLQLDRLITAIPDPKKFPYFYYAGYRTSLHMMSEPLLLFETVYIENRSILELLDPKFSWRSKMLSANYKGNAKAPIDVQVQIFERVPLTDPREGGILTNAAVMTMTSTPTRTQPITRGAWVNAVVFNDPPEAPPADVPPLPEGNEEELAKLTIRERLAAHRERKDCAGCHNKIDPLGFALENYGPTGVWRDKYENGREVDTSGVLFNQHEFTTFPEFKRLIVEDKRRFYRGFISHLLSYGLARELGPADSPTLDTLTADAVAGDDGLRTILKHIAMSEPFLHKNTRSRATPSAGPANAARQADTNGSR